MQPKCWWTSVGAKGIVNTLFTTWKTAQTTNLAHAGHLLVAASQDFVGIGLMAHIPHQPVFRRVENVMESHRQLDRSQVGAEMSAGLRNRLNQTLTQLFGQRGQVVSGQFSKLRWGLNPIKQGTHHLPQYLFNEAII